MKGLYIHIPFCKKICTYCDFYKRIAGENLKKRYIEILLKEIDLKGSMFSDIKTLYIGGGTPSALGVTLLEHLYDKLSTFLDLGRLQESTIEVNPEDITHEFGRCLQKHQVSRVSIGVQSFNPKKLQILGRSHSYEQIKKGLDLLHSYGINNINLDLMYGIDGFNLGDLDQELDLFISLKPNHISAYSLQLEPHTVLYNQYLKGKYQLMSEDLESKMYFHIIERLHQAGYLHYETSNFCQPDCQSIHNLIYWKNEQYLGLGAAASYYIDDVRYTNAMNLESYFAGVLSGKLIYHEEVKVSKEEQMQEELMLGLRLTEGISENYFMQRFGQTVETVFPNIETALKRELLVRREGKIAINYPYLYLSNYVLGEILS